MLRKFVLKNINLISIIIFVIFFMITILARPSLIFDKSGKPREFGLGYKNKTIAPIWLIMIILAILSYLIVLYYVNFRKFAF